MDCPRSDEGMGGEGYFRSRFDCFCPSITTVLYKRSERKVDLICQNNYLFYFCCSMCVAYFPTLLGKHKDTLFYIGK